MTKFDSDNAIRVDPGDSSRPDISIYVIDFDDNPSHDIVWLSAGYDGPSLRRDRLPELIDALQRIYEETS